MSGAQHITFARRLLYKPSILDEDIILAIELAARNLSVQSLDVCILSLRKRREINIASKIEPVEDVFGRARSRLREIIIDEEEAEDEENEEEDDEEGDEENDEEEEGDELDLNEEEMDADCLSCLEDEEMPSGNESLDQEYIPEEINLEDSLDIEEAPVIQRSKVFRAKSIQLQPKNEVLISTNTNVDKSKEKEMQVKKVTMETPIQEKEKLPEKKVTTMETPLQEKISIPNSNAPKIFAKGKTGERKLPPNTATPKLKSLPKWMINKEYDFSSNPTLVSKSTIESVPGEHSLLSLIAKVKEHGHKAGYIHENGLDSFYIDEESFNLSKNSVSVIKTSHIQANIRFDPNVNDWVATAIIFS